MAFILSTFKRIETQEPSKGDTREYESPDCHKCKLSIPMCANIDLKMDDSLEKEDEGNEAIDEEHVLTTGMFVIDPCLKHLIVDAFPVLIFTH